MRFIEFGNLLNEVSMAPGTLKKLASAINGVCGIEFELYYPTPDELSAEVDDEPAYNFNDIEEFFTQYEANRRHVIQRHLDDMYSRYVSEQLEAQWEDHEKTETIKDYILKEYWDTDEKYQEIYRNMELTDEEIEKVEDVRVNSNFEDKHAVKLFDEAAEEFDQALEIEAERSIRKQDDIYKEAYNEWYEENMDFIDQSDCLTAYDINHMSDFSNKFDNVYWPTRNTEDEIFDYVSEVFSQQVEEASTYPSDIGQLYVIESDGSLHPEDDYHGVEIVSPALSIPKMIKDLYRVSTWAKSNGCYTDRWCGLHINVSIKDVDLENLDYVKLALFVGDQHVLKLFERELNNYCKSAVLNIKRRLNADPSLGTVALDTIQKDLSSMAGKIIHDTNTEKYTSINVHEDRVEFRSPGNDWLNFDLKTLEHTIYRFLVALDIACDPQKHKEEYAKKLYKLISPDAEWNPLMNLYSQYRAGLIDKDTAVAMAYIKPKTVTQKPKLPDNTWNVTLPDGRQITVQAKTEKGAINQTRTQLKLNSINYPDKVFQVEPNVQTDIFRSF